jgi:hypothetical protein
MADKIETGASVLELAHSGTAARGPRLGADHGGAAERTIEAGVLAAGQKAPSM